MKKLRYHKQLDFNEPGDDFNLLMKLLLSGEEKVICMNLNVKDKKVLRNLGETVERCYREKFPESHLSPEIELYEYEYNKCYIVSLNLKMK